MRKTAERVLVAVFVACVVSVSAAPAQPLSIAQVMTPIEMAATGVNSLTAAQRLALDRWLNDYTLRVIQLAKGAGVSSSSSPGEYARVGSGHWIKKVSSAGRIVELEDGSIWEIYAIDRIYTAIWLPVSNITIVGARAPIGEYKYSLINKDDGETALAKYLGK